MSFYPVLQEEKEPQITHMDILAFINGWDLVNKDNIIVNDLNEQEEITEEDEE